MKRVTGQSGPNNETLSKKKKFQRKTKNLWIVVCIKALILRERERLLKDLGITKGWRWFYSSCFYFFRFLFIVCVLHMYMYVHHMHAVLIWARRGCYRGNWDWSYRGLLAAMWMLGPCVLWKNCQCAEPLGHNKLSSCFLNLPIVYISKYYLFLWPFNKHSLNITFVSYFVPGYGGSYFFFQTTQILDTCLNEENKQTKKNSDLKCVKSAHEPKDFHILCLSLVFINM